MVHSHNTFVFQSLLKDGVALKIPFFSITIPYNACSFFVGVKSATTRTSSYISFISYQFFHFVFNCFSDSFQQNIRIFKSLNDFFISFISLFEIIKAVIPEPCIFFWIPASITKAAAVIPNWAKIFLAKGTATYINGLLVYSTMILKILQIELF